MPISGWDLELRQLAGDLAHWRAAAHALGDLDAVAAPAAWAALESYLGLQLRQRLRDIAAGLAGESDRLAGTLETAQPAQAPVLREQMLALRRRYLQAETVIAFFGEAVNHRTTPHQSRLLRGLDTLAVDSMQVVLRPMRLQAPPVLTYVDKGLGASILKADVRLWDDGSLSPAAAVKITGHQLAVCPTSFAHETGHQVAHMVGWNAELAEALRQTLRPFSPVAADIWRSWASEVAADVHAFVVLGYGPVRALANVVDGTSQEVFNLLPGDPHPFGWIRVLLNVEFCSLWFGPGPWDELAAVWRQRHPLDAASAEARHVAEASLQALRDLAELCTRTPMRAFGGRPIGELADPRLVSPTALENLAARAGASLYTSSYLQRQESLRILAWNALLLALNPKRAPELSLQLQSWLARLGADESALAA
jgi:hypothetical protein